MIRTPRTLPRILLAGEVDDLVAALRTDRDRAMVEAMLLAGLRRNEVLGLRFCDLHPGERRVFVADGKAATSGWCPWPGDSSALSATTWITSGRRRRTPSGYSSS